jgi:hypothetical protein
MRLRFMHPAVGEVVFPVQVDSTIVIGRRGGGAGIELNWDKRISRRHATMRIGRDGSVFYTDLGSSNGSYLGARRISGEIRFEKGMSILVGETVMIVSDLEEDLPDPWGSESTDTRRAQGEVDEDSELVHSGHAPFDTEDMTTKELQSPEAAIPIEPAFVEAASRTTARFVGAGEVEVLFSDRAGFASFWQHELSKTGLFVMTEVPPPFGSRVDVRIETPDGSVAVATSVVHVVDGHAARKFQMSPGAGLLVANMSRELRDALDRYARGEIQKLGVPETPSLSSENALAIARHIIAEFDANRYYEALGVSPTIDGEGLAARLQSLEDVLGSSPTTGAANKARIQAALDVLSKLSTTLGVQQRRLQYDFRNGHLRLRERVEAARSGGGAPIGELRRAWNFVFPERVDRAAMLMRQAFASSHERDFATAIRVGTEALELNPFFEQLETYIRQWKAAQDLS